MRAAPTSEISEPANFFKNLEQAFQATFPASDSIAPYIKPGQHTGAAND